MIKILAIETSCDETAAAVIEDGRKILSSVVKSQIKEHRIYGGVVPEIASRKHVEFISQVTESALENSKLSLKDLNCIAVTYAPGLVGSLLVGINFAKSIAFASKLPLIGVHHLKGHIAANYLIHKNLKPPFLCLAVSGGSTSIIKVKDYTEFEIIGQTRDDAAGEAFDKAARALGLPYPGGVFLDKIADSGDSFKFNFPRPNIKNYPYDFSFSGIKTSIINIINNLKQKKIDINLYLNDLASSFRCSVVDYLIDKFISAAESINYKKLSICGGVAANSLLRKKLSEECKKRDFDFFYPPKELCSDNAAMIGSQAYYEYINNNFSGLNLNACTNLAL